MTAPLPLPDVPVEAVEPRPNRRPIDNRVLYGLTALLMFCVLAFGGREPWAIFAFQAGAAILFLIWLLKQMGQADKPNFRWNPLFAPMLAFASLICIQLIPGVSAYWHATYSQLLQFVAYGIVCWLLVQTLTHSRQVRRIGYALTIFGISVAVFAVVQNLSSPHKLYWLLTPRFGGWIYGPYVNHNHYAGLMEMLVPIPLVFAFSRFAHQRERWIAASAAAFMSATIFLSGSRGGMIALAMQIVLFLYFVVRERQKENVAILLGGFLLIGVAVIAWSGGREVSTRIATLAADKRSEVSPDVRMQIDRDTLKMALQRPILGWGQGTFPEVYPRFRSFYTDSLVNAAHNDYLQALAETGIVGFGIMIWLLVSALRPAACKSKTWTSDLNGAVSVAAILGISGILVHSLVDFNMQLPANAALFYSLCTVAAMEPRFTHYRRGHHKPETGLPTESPVPVNA